MGSIKTQSSYIRGKQMPWPSKKRALAVAVASALSVGPVLAQDESDVEEEVVVTGIRQNLMNAQELKYNADTVIDSITADDLGSFPDKSIAEALQRVSGITVNRFAATADTAHFSAEPSGVIVRGLTLVRTEFNGRDSFSANSSRGLSWTDVSPELMSRVDTYKNQMAELIEGGIAGTVDMRTRLPFDQEGTMMVVSAAANYNDLAEETTPEVSGIYSNRWDMAGGSEFGVMANLAYSEVNTRSEGIQLLRMARYQDVYGQGTFYYIPTAISFRDNEYERERNGASVAAQWASSEDTLLVSMQYNRSEYDQAWEEYVVSAITPGDDAAIGYGQSVNWVVDGNRPADDGSGDIPNNINSFNFKTLAPMPYDPETGLLGEFTFDSRGLFQTGVMTRGSGWWGNNDAEAAVVAENETGQSLVRACYGWNGCSPSLRGIDVGTTTRSNNNTNITEDMSLNFKWNLSDSIRSNYDFQMVQSEVKNYDIEAAFVSFANAEVDLSGKRPVVAFSNALNVNESLGGLANPNNYYLRSIMDHVEDSEGEQVAFRTDFEFDIGTAFLESLKVGARVAEREQTVRWTTYNWQNVVNTWSGNSAAYFNLDRHDPANGAGGQPGFTGYPESFYGLRSFRSEFFDGNNLTPNTYVFANMDMLQNQQLWASTMGASALGLTGGAGWDPICSNTGDRSAEVPGTCFRPNEVTDLIENTEALYLQLNFGGGPISGNIGVRYVETTSESAGGIGFPVLADQDSVDQPTGGMDPVPFTVGHYLSQADRDFMNGVNVLNTVEVEHEHTLPSFNIKFEITDEFLTRFAASRAMSRPDVGNLRNYIGVSYSVPTTADASDPRWIKDGMGTITGVDVRYTANAQNPYLKPTVADQFDLSFEYYFGDPGSLTLTLFDKEFDNYIQFGRQDVELTNNGVTRVVEVSRPLNGEGASLKGYEVAFKSFFDFLPAPFDGLGMELSYTSIDNEGITNTNTTPVGDGTVITGQAPNQIVVDSLESLSDEAYTAILMYENSSMSARLAYSWRSEYLVTATDCCIAYPVWNDDYGQVDGSIRWNISDSAEVSLQGTNLTNEETRTSQQVSDADDGALLFPTGYFQNDRRFTIGFTFRN